MAGTSINLPDDVMARIENAAASEKLTPAALVLEAVEEHLRRKRRESLYERGHRRTRKLGIPEEEVDAIAREERDKLETGR